jgi:endoplasmic reticulum-Golgi intermediate compartment protein 2
MAASPTEESILDRLDNIAPPSMKQFDAFPKLPTTYKARSGERGFLTILVAAISFLLVLNDIGEYFFGWPTYGYGIDKNEQSYMDINVDLVVGMPCRCERA